MIDGMGNTVEDDGVLIQCMNSKYHQVLTDGVWLDEDMIDEDGNIVTVSTLTNTMIDHCHVDISKQTLELTLCVHHQKKFQIFSNVSCSTITELKNLVEQIKRQTLSIIFEAIDIAGIGITYTQNNDQKSNTTLEFTELQSKSTNN